MHIAGLPQHIEDKISRQFQDFFRGFNIFSRLFKDKNHDTMTSVCFFQDFFSENFKTISELFSKLTKTDLKALKFISFKCEREQRTQCIYTRAYQGTYTPCTYSVLVMVCTSNGCVQVTGVYK